MSPIRILIVDDQSLFRESLHAYLAMQKEFEVVGEALHGQEALRLAGIHKPDVILMDVRMPVLDGVETTRLLHEAHPECKIIMLTTFDDDEYVFEALRNGAVGYLLKDTSTEKLLEAVRAVSHGESFIQPSIQSKVVAEFARMARQVPSQSVVLAEPLSPRESEILRMVAHGDSNREIATRLFITEGTVKNHVTNILEKMNVTDRTQAAIKAKENGLI
jgi:DNA-binding NarL/FixJ family response regulator